MTAEATRRNVNHVEAWEDVNYVSLEVVDDFYQKASAIMAGVEYDTRVSVPIELPDEELFQLMRMAHERDITLNQLVEEALRLAIENMETV
jgi:predicted HicB family RNase H-like nuclease